MKQTASPQEVIDRLMERWVKARRKASEPSANCKLGHEPRRRRGDTMAKFKVPEAERNELFAIVESTKADIVCG